MKTIILLLLVAITAEAQQTSCLQSFTVACDPTVSKCEGDGFVNGPISSSCDYGNIELDIVRWANSTTDLTLLDFDTSGLAGQQVVTASLNPTVSWSSISDSMAIIGEYVTFPIFPCNPSLYSNTITNTAITAFPTSDIPYSGPITIPLANVGNINTTGHTRLRIGLANGADYNEVDFWSYDGSPARSFRLDVWSTGPKCPTPSPTALPTPTATPGCQWNGTACAALP